MKTVGISALCILLSAACVQEEITAPDPIDEVTEGEEPVDSEDVIVEEEILPEHFIVDSNLNVVVLPDGEHLVKVTALAQDDYGVPAAGVEIFGSFSGSYEEAVYMVTDADGIAAFSLDGLTGHLSIGFKVDSVAYPVDGRLVMGSVTSDPVAAIPCYHGSPQQ